MTDTKQTTPTENQELKPIFWRTAKTMKEYIEGIDVRSKFTDFLTDGTTGRPIEGLTIGGNGSEENSFILQRNEPNDYIGDEHMVISLVFDDLFYNKVGQALLNIDGKNIDEIDIEYSGETEHKKRKVYFDLSNVWGDLYIPGIG